MSQPKFRCYKGDCNEVNTFSILDTLKLDTHYDLSRVPIGLPEDRYVILYCSKCGKPNKISLTREMQQFYQGKKP